MRPLKSGERMTIRPLHENEMTPEISKKIDKKLQGADQWAQDALSLIRKVYLLNPDNITEEKIEGMKDHAANLLPKRFIKDVWGSSE